MRKGGPVGWLLACFLFLPAPARAQTPEPAPSLTMAADRPLAAVPGGAAALEPTTGSFSHVIPIEVPSFRGIEPRLALQYSSQAGNGSLGVGWRLGGFGAVERTRTGRGTPRFNSADVYVLDEMELVPCAQAATTPGCAAGGSHATKQEGYLRVKFESRMNTWTVSVRNGVKTEYGAVYQASSGTLRWGRRKVTDTAGNRATYEWECAGGDCYPKRVTFGPYVVTVYRETTQRPDVLSFATGGLSGLGKTLYRLRSILVARGTTPIRAYRLTYEPSPATGRSLLKQVQLCGTDVQIDTSGAITGGHSLPPQVFSYEGGQ